ncbi:hypothetical protein KEM56_005705, partial [Ascosphaera pollenicola]
EVSRQEHSGPALHKPDLDKSGQHPEPGDEEGLATPANGRLEGTHDPLGRTRAAAKRAQPPGPPRRAANFEIVIQLRTDKD